MNELNMFCFITNLAVTVLCGALLPVYPALTRKSYLFGVKIPWEEQASPEAKELKKRYITICLTGAAAILALVVIQYAILPGITLIATLYFPLLFAALQVGAFVPHWREAVKLKEARGWQASGSVFAETKSSYSRGNLSELPWGWYALGLLAIFIGVVVTLLRYPELPARIPTHFDAHMQPDAWSDKSLLTVMFMPLINVSTLLIMWLTGFMFVRAKLQIDPQNPALSFAQHRIYRRRMGGAIGFMALGMASALTLLGLKTVFVEMNISFGLMIAMLLLPSVPVVVIPLRSGQGGCKIIPGTIIENAVDAEKSPSVGGGAFGRGDDKHWAFGMFYYNPDDPAYIMEDRFGIGLGFNYARLPVKIGAVAALLAFVAGYAWLTVWLGASL